MYVDTYCIFNKVCESPVQNWQN